MTDRRGVRWAVVVALALAIALVLAALVLRGPNAGAGQGQAGALPDELTGGVSARESFPPALAVAQDWQPDVQLAIVSAHWRQVRGRWPSRAVWTFQYYSPSVRRMAIVTVEDGRAHLLRETRASYPLPTFDPEVWRVDSPAAVQRWWEEGGSAFATRHREMELLAQLRVADGDGNSLRWTVTGIAGDRVWTVVIDGTTGEPVRE